MPAHQALSDKTEIADLIQKWGLCRDQARWEELLAFFAPGGTISVSWFSGPATDFIARATKMFDPTRTRNITKHQLWPSLVQVNGDRAVAETSVAINARQTFDGLTVDNTSYARFHDKLVRTDGVWGIQARIAIYEKDRMDAVDDPEAFAAFMKATDFSGVPTEFKFIGYRIVATGRQIADDVHLDATDRVRDLYAAGEAWLAEG